MFSSDRFTKDEEDIIFFAFRYALGRHTYAPSLIAGYITSHLHAFPDHTLDQFVREIDRELRYRPLSDTTGHDEWIKLRTAIINRERKT